MFTYWIQSSQRRSSDLAKIVSLEITLQIWIFYVIEMISTSKMYNNSTPLTGFVRVMQILVI